MNENKTVYQERIYQAISNAMGPVIRDLLADDRVIEILLNPDGELWVERLGEGMNDSGHKMSQASAETLIRHIASQSGEECNEHSPSLSAILPGSLARFQAFIKPVVDAPAFSIRKRATRVFSLEDYEADGIITPSQRELILSAVSKRQNILVVGGTGTGKTTLANAILKEMSESGDRIITIEDTPELQCTAHNKTQLYTKTDIGFDMKKAVREVLRMRPDRIVVGEVRDGSALDLLKAWNTGHSGGLATIHANSARLALKRLESLIGEVSHNVPRDLITEAINLIISIKRISNKRIVDEVVQLSMNKDLGYEFLAI